MSTDSTLFWPFGVIPMVPQPYVPTFLRLFFLGNGDSKLIGLLEAQVNTGTGLNLNYLVKEPEI